jgi:hypothetical protein
MNACGIPASSSIPAMHRAISPTPLSVSKYPKTLTPKGRDGSRRLDQALHAVISPAEGAKSADGSSCGPGAEARWRYRQTPLRSRRYRGRVRID